MVGIAEFPYDGCLVGVDPLAIAGQVAEQTFIDFYDATKLNILLNLIELRTC